MTADESLQPKPERLQSATRALAVLDVLAGHPGGATPKAIAAELSLHLSTTYHLLNTLIAAGYATRCAECRLFRLGPRVPVLHETFIASIRPSPTSAGLARALHEATGETTHLCRLLGDDVVTAEVIEGARPGHVAGTRVGITLVSHAVAAGRALLAWQPAARIDAYLSRADLFARMPHLRLNDPNVLRAELRRIRGKGVALDGGEVVPELCCIAVPLPAIDGQVSEALALLVARSRFEREQSALVATVLAIGHVAATMREAELIASKERALDAEIWDDTDARWSAIVAGHGVYLDAAYPRLV